MSMRTEMRKSGAARLLSILLPVALLMGIAAILLYGYHAGWFLPRWIEWKSGRQVLRGYSVEESSGPSSGAEAGTAGADMEVSLEKRVVRVLQDGECIWSSPPEIKVQDVLCCDIDGDRTEELLLLCWKIGRFGKSRPFWVSEDEKNWSQHLFVYEPGPDGIKPQWMSSYMGTDVAEMTVGLSDVEEDGGSTAFEALDGTTVGTDGRTSSGAPDGLLNRTSDAMPGGTDATNVEDALPEGRSMAAVNVLPRFFFRSPDGSVSQWFWDSWGFTRID